MDRLLTTLLCTLVLSACSTVQPGVGTSSLSEEKWRIVTEQWVESDPNNRFVRRVGPTGSMRPTLDVQMILLIERITDPSQLRVHDIVIAPVDWHERGIVLHRITDIRGGRVYTKGDGTLRHDPGYSPRNGIHWRVAGILHTDEQ